MTIRGYYSPPDPINGYLLSPEVSPFSIVVPPRVDVTNLFLNPSFELNLTGVNKSVGTETTAMDATYQRRGIYSCKVITAATLGSGVYQSVSVTSGVAYTFSVDHLGTPNRQYRLTINGITVLTFKGTGFWQRVYGIINATATTSWNFAVQVNQAVADTFWTDGWMVHSGARRETYIDGDQTGFGAPLEDYYWTGAPHASQSIRNAQSRAGGEIISMDRYGFRLLAMAGLGLGFVANISMPLSSGGAYFQRTMPKDRSFSIVGQWDEMSPQELNRKKAALEAVLTSHYTAYEQPLLIRYQPTNECGDPVGEVLEIPCLYEGGLEGAIDSNFSLKTSLNFHVFLPWLGTGEGNNGATLSLANSITTTGALLKRDTLGNWSSFGTVAGGNYVSAIAVAPNGDIYVAGLLTNISGTAVSGCAKYSNGAWSALGTGFGGAGSLGNTVAIDPADGLPVFGGDFTTANGVTVNRLAKWTGATFTAYGTGASSGQVFRLLFGNDGKLYAFGSFNNIGGVSTSGTAYWTGAWNDMAGTYKPTNAQGAAVGPEGYIYAVNGGYFSKWTGSTWIKLADMSGTPMGLVFGPDGAPYVFGLVTFPGTIYNIAKWANGGWLPLDTSPADGTPGLVTGYYYGTSLYVAGLITSAGGLPMTGLALWNGTAWIYPDLRYTSGTVHFNAIASDAAGTLYFGTDTTGAATAAATTTVTNTGPNRAYPRITWVGPGAIYVLRNYTTGATIYFNLTLQAGETAVLDLSETGGISFYSNLRGNLLGNILAGSTFDFFLQPGPNAISLLVTGTTGASAAAMTWKTHYDQIDSLTR